MKKTKRLVSFVTATAFLLSSVAPALAADVNASIGRLGALGVVKGYNAAGTDFKPEQNITRAEFAAVAVRMLGLEAAESAAKGGTKFKDVAASHWGSGYINLAVGNGIIKGYPDGTFKPEANVTYAEAFAMLVRVLGYDPVVKGTWPTNYIGKASQLGLLDGVTLSDYNGAATRGNVFLGADNALEEKVLIEDGYDNQGKVTYKVDTSLMEKRLSVTKLAEAEVTGAPNYSTGLQKDQIQLGSTTYKVTAGLDPNAYIGVKAVAWKKDDKIFFLDVKTASSDIITDKIKSINSNATSNYSETLSENEVVKLDKLDKEYKVAGTPNIWRNFAKDAAVTVGDEVRIVLDGGKIKTLVASKYTSNLVKKANTTDEKIDFKVGSAFELKDKTTTLVKDGKVIALADIKENDIVDYIANGDVRYGIVTSKTVEGKLTAAGTDAKTLTIDGKEVKATGSIYVSTDGGKTYDSTAKTTGNDLSSLFGRTIKGYLTKGGAVAFISASEQGEAVEFPVVIKEIKRVSGTTDATYIYVSKGDGTNVYYEVNEDTKYGEGNDKVDKATLTDTNPVIKRTGGSGENDTLNVGEIVKISLTADNKVQRIKEYANIANEVSNDAAKLPASADGMTIVKSSDTISVNGSVPYKVTSSTVILKVKDYNPAADALLTTTNKIDKIEKVTWDALKATGSDTGARVAVVNKDGNALVIVIYSKNTSIAGDYQYGIVSGTSTNVDGTVFNVNTDKASSISKNTSDAAAKGDVIAFKINSSDKIASTDVIDNLDIAITTGSKAVSTAVYYRVYEVKTDLNRIVVKKSDQSGAVTDSTERYLDVNANTKFFETKLKADGTVDTVTGIDFSSLSDGDVIRAYDAKDSDDKKQGDSGFKNDEAVADFILKIKK